MRALLSTYGSRGDAEPMVGLAVRLRALGAEVRVCVEPDFAELLVRVGVPLVPVGQPARGRVGRRAVRHRRRGSRGIRCADRERRDAGRRVAMTEHAVVIAGGGPKG